MDELSASSSHITEIQILSFFPLKEKGFAGLDLHLLSLFIQSDSDLILCGMSTVWIN